MVRGCGYHLSDSRLIDDGISNWWTSQDEMEAQKLRPWTSEHRGSLLFKRNKNMSNVSGKEITKNTKCIADQTAMTLGLEGGRETDS